MFPNSPFDFMTLSPYDSTSSLAKAVEHWLATVCAHNADDIVSLYAPDGVLLGTIAKSIKRGRREVKTYFDMFVKKKPCGTITSMTIQNIGDIGVADGTYTFELTENGKTDSVPARFTFVFRKINGVWKIATHHSSAQP